jgi:hypothetical protein
MAEYNHIEIMREEIVKSYRFTPFRNAPRPPVRNNLEHGQKLKSEITDSLESIKSRRRDIGIQSENLVVLELLSEAMSPDILENMLRKFNLYLVEETEIPNTNNSRLLIQFENVSSLNSFNNERGLWENNSEEDAILTVSQRGKLFSCIENIRSVSREDRIGIRLKKYIEDPTAMPEGLFAVNIDIWFNGETNTVFEVENQIKQAMGTTGSKLLGDLFTTPSLLLGRAFVNEYSLNALLDLDIIATVELPFSTVSTEPYELFKTDFTPIAQDDLDENAPLATILDSGVFTGNPLLENVVVAEEEFDTTENTTTDMNGHGTAVAGIVVYGDFDACLSSRVFKPLVRICNGKIMHNESGFSGKAPCFPEDKRPEQIVKEAIEYFNKEYGCRIFNLSAGDSDHLYTGGRQFAWAEMLDQLSKQLDIVIVISAGNVSKPPINDFLSRDELMEKCRDQLFYPEHRLIDPATSALSVTVGSITRFDEPEVTPNRVGRISAGKKNYLSVFTRIGKGVNRAIKPEFVDYGGNYGVHQISRGNTKWITTDRKLVEPTLHNGNDQIFKGYCGTSFSAPHVTHIAARIERALEAQIKNAPTANLIRAVLANSAKCTPEMIKWAEASKDSLYTGKTNPKQERRLRLMGFGKVDDSLLYSSDNNVTLIAEDRLELRSFHLYKIPVPEEFLKVRAEKTISISLSYNPITRMSRKDYLTNNLWFEVFRKIDENTLLQYKAKKASDQDEDEDLSNLPDSNKADFSPGYTEIMKGTLQQRMWQKGPRGGKDLLWDENEPYIYLLVTGKERFKYAEQEVPQDYALAITFSYTGKEDIKLYNNLKNNVRIRERAAQRERARTQI